MNKAKLKAYAPQARKDFIAAVTARANQLGLSEIGSKLEVAPAEKGGDVVVIAGQPWPAKVQGQREQLIMRIRKDGFAQTMEAVAYTWFNRFAALRFMEIHDYLGHGHRALSSREGGLPEILTHAAELAQSGELPGLNAAQVTELKLAGNKDGELYKMLLVAQCNALSRAMPFLFEHIDDETELLLPDNLLRTDSIIAKLVDAIPEEDWRQVEIIGWLYQFYISEKKDEVIGKVVKSEDIPAATQLFTPNWIVQYLVQNSVGRLWLMADPTSTLKSQWPYYIEPAEQTPEVQAQLDALIQTRMDEDGGSLNPETITVLDPACGSGHILVEAYEVLKGIYLERGYRLRDIPRLILEKNLYGLDIDDRAAQMAGFALLMKARADDRRLLNEPPKINVLALQESKGLDLDQIEPHLTPFGIQRRTLKVLLDTFSHAKAFGSLIQIPQALNVELARIAEDLQKAIDRGDLYAKAAAQDLMPLAQQAMVLGRKLDAVVANPPYMGSKGMNPALKEFAKASFPDSKSDLFAMFIERGFGWCKPTGFNSMVTMQSWMFLSSFEAMREKLLTDRTIITMAHLGPRAFSEISGEVVQTTAFILQCKHFSGLRPSFFRLLDGQEEQKETGLRLGQSCFDAMVQDDLRKIPGCPIAYWISLTMLSAFSGTTFGQIAEPRRGLQPGNVPKHVRFWFEVSNNEIAWGATRENVESLSKTKRWFLFNSGGGYRRWFGNVIHVVNWGNNGHDIKTGHNPIVPNEHLYLRNCVTWSKVSSSAPSFRLQSANVIPGDAGPFAIVDDVIPALGLLNSKVTEAALEVINPSLNYQVGDLARVPARFDIPNEHRRCIEQCIEISKKDWGRSETAFSFSDFSLTGELRSSSLVDSWNGWSKFCTQSRQTILELEKTNNSFFIEAYGLQDEISPEVPEDQITLASANREKDCLSLISYAIGCMMGRYSLDEPGLIYAHAGNVGFDATRYTTFPADADGIVPLTDELWFEDDAASRVREFLLAVWGADTLDENMAWLAESLGKRTDETPEETIRRYLADKFFKDHLQTYKKRPIYWLFSSGKQGAFQALVYLHRYHEGTLARMRAEYVVPLTGKIQSRIGMLEKDAAAATSTAARNKINKKIEALRKKHVELLAYDEKLRHYADMRIKLDLDDGVKVNYGKFGDLLAEVKAVTGGSGDE